jgi:hypothetical protein
MPMEGTVVLKCSKVGGVSKSGMASGTSYILGRIKDTKMASILEKIVKD